MADPVLVNRRPDESDTGVTVSTPFRFGVRDVDTRVDLSTVYSAVVYGKGIYAPDEDLPAQDDALLAEAEVVFSSFDDASGTTVPGNPCDQTLETSGDDTVYRIEKSDADGTAQEGVLFVSADFVEVCPIGASAQIDLAYVDTETTDYLSYTDFVGVIFGLVYWPENTGVFLFFRDDGTKKVSIVGPSEDGTGTRSVETTTTFDWSAESYTYSIVIDPTIYRRKVLVFATDSEGEETLLAELALDDFNEFLNTVRMGTLYAEDSPSKVTMVLGLDAPDMGNYIDIHSFVLSRFGSTLVTSGGPTGSSSVTITPFESLLTVGSAGLDDWLAVGDGELEKTDNSCILVATEGSAYYSREEADLVSEEWLVIGKLAGGVDALHPGFYPTGMTLTVEDGSQAIKLHFLDDFASNFLAVEEEDADEGTVSGYKIDQTGHDWTTAFTFQLMGSASRDELLLEVNGETALEHAYSASYPESEETAIKFGYTEEGAFSGSFYLFYLWVFPNCTFFVPASASYPDDQGWLRAAASGTRSVETGSFEIDCSTTGSYDIYYVEDAEHDATSGAAAIFSMTLEEWTNASGAASAPRSEFGPVAAVRADATAAQLFFVKGLDGVVYLYLPHDSSAVSDVLSQNSVGRAVSAEIDLDQEHTFILDVKPRHWIRVYVDLDPVPVIEVDWEDSSSGLRALPTNMPEDAVVAIGSLGEDDGVKAQFSSFRASIGRGYDFSATPEFTETELQDYVYGSSVTVVLDAQDED